VPIRRKVFISYHHADQDEVDRFIRTFDHNRDVFIARGLGREMSQDIIDSLDTAYVMSRIRELFLADSSVTLVLVGRCTWARRYVDWELQASLRSGQTVTPNGVLGIVLPSAAQSPVAPDRLQRNVANDGSKYARWYHYPLSADILSGWIEEAFAARTTKAHLIDNPRERFAYNRNCQ
jgi:antiphage defense system Thoeris ThsB-like protein